MKDIFTKLINPSARRALCMLIVLCALCPLFALAQTAPSLSLPEFLDELGLAFDEYAAIMAALEKTGLYPHYLKENASRYVTFQYDYPEVTVSTAIAYVNVNADFEFYTDIQDVPNPYLTSLLVNKHHRMPTDWAPDDMVSIGAGHIIREEAAEAFTLMRDAMRADGLDLHVVSAYRSYSSQASSHSSAERFQGLAAADSSYARPGHSEHQTGLALDILHMQHIGSLSRARFQDTPEFEWLSENAHNYGFILRYPEEYSDIHGYIYEPWHWRYVGVDIATAMRESGIIVYEEFYGKYLAPGVLYRARELILWQRDLAETEGDEGFEREVSIRQAEEAAEREAFQQAEGERLAALAELAAAAPAQAQVYDNVFFIAAAIIVTAFSGTVVDVYEIFTAKGRPGGTHKNMVKLK